MEDYLKKAGVPYKLTIVKNGGHAFWAGDVEPSAEEQSKITADFAIDLLTK